ncbi:hypothetical protein HNQ59_001811 [Chitinivorax tropicus]|uniref:Uncharacterized protein n=1 Tax=Chitinivorax tropicus TaxID=714531 RepID=A0A840MP50_9PROT|nr:hydrolase [Chitinivorax tropicus]MBB5018522.1 hypothetical protein [Chitinivorax tropicus]
MEPSTTRECCPKFDPTPWDGNPVIWHEKKFVKDHVTSFLHIPLNYGAVMARNLEAIEAAGALPESRLILTDENSLWGADVYFEVTKAIPSRTTIQLSGTFLAKAFEGSYSKIKQWMSEMSHYVKEQGKQIEKLYFFYTTCPKCAKKYGKNYVVLIAKV